MTYQSKPEKQTTYPEMLTSFEEKRKKGWVMDKASQKANLKTITGANKVRNVQMLQRFSGKKGK